MRKVIFTLTQIILIFSLIILTYFYSKLNYWFLLFIASLGILEGIFLYSFGYLDKIKDPNVLSGIIVVAFVYIFCLYTYNKTFSVAEGWYTVYAQQILSGKSMYVDFELLFTPLYSWIITIIVWIFGTNILILRTIGVILFVLSSFYIFKIFKLITNSYVSVAATICTILIMQSEAVQINYDYIIFFNLFNYMGIYYFLKSLIDLFNSKSKAHFSAFLSGLFFMFSLLIRQATGVVTSFFGICSYIFILFLHKNKKEIFKLLRYYVLGLLLPFTVTIIILLSCGQFKDFIYSTIVGASSSKGGIVAILTAWIPRVFTPKALIVGSFIFILAFLITLVKIKNDLLYKINANLFYIFSLSAFLLFILCITNEYVRTWFVNFNSTNYLMYFVISNLFIFIYCCMTLLIKKIRNLNNEDNDILLAILSGFIFFTNLGCAFSASVSEGQGALNYAFIIIYFYIKSKGLVNDSISSFFVYLSCILFAFSGFSKKLNCSYVWWGLSQGTYQEQNTEFENIEELKGIFVTPQNKKNIEDIVSIIKNDDSAKTLYCFPQNPIFYTLTDIMPITKTIPSWFDIASDKSLGEDLELLKQNPVDYIIVDYCSEDTMYQHEQLFRDDGKKSKQRSVYEWIDSMIASGVYEIVLERDLNEGVGPYYPIRVLKLSDSFVQDLNKYESMGLRTEFLDIKMNCVSQKYIYLSSENKKMPFSSYYLSLKYDYYLDFYKELTNIKIDTIAVSNDELGNLPDSIKLILDSAMFLKKIYGSKYTFFVADETFVNSLQEKDYSFGFYSDGWTMKDCYTSLFVEKKDKLIIKFFVSDSLGKTSVKFLVNGYEKKVECNQSGVYDVTFEVAQNCYNTIIIHIDNEFTPVIGVDERPLGILINGIYTE